ncbi:MAG: sensor histidine kinase [Candidatus Dormibacteraeota bacterium]|nr:sensor histidine kinase [Candidatus Dormibacteraeota bacterium]
MNAALASPSLPQPMRIGAQGWFFRLTPLYGEAFVVVGALITWRRPGNRIGYLAVAIGVLWALYQFAVGYDDISTANAGGSLAGTGVAEAIRPWFWVVPAVLMLLYLPLLFPDGRPASPVWVPIIGVLTAVGAVGIVGGVVLPQAASTLPGPISRGFGGLSDFGFALCVVLAPTAVMSRYRRATLDVRQQLKWLGAAYVVFALVSAAGFVVNATVLHRPAFSFSPLFEVLIAISMLGVALSVGIAIFKYHLYDIDVIIRRTLVYGAVVVLIGLLYLFAVVAIGTRIGTSAQRDEAIPFLVAAVVALAFQPVRTRLTRVANRLVFGKRATPYEVLSQFNGAVEHVYSHGELTERMAHLLADGTGADRAEVWLRVGDELRPEAFWPETATDHTSVPLRLSGAGAPEIPGAVDQCSVTFQDELLGVLAVRKREPMRGVEHRLITDLAHEAAVALRNTRLTAELEDGMRELQASRQRLVSAQDEERRRLERDLHDGAQQNLVALKIQLGLATTLAERNSDTVRAMLKKLTSDADEAIQVLRRFSHGIYPPILVEKGLEAALASHVRLLPLPVEVKPASPLPRLPRQTESAVYFCVLEALTNVVKHAHATGARIELAAGDGRLTFAVVDDGHGFDPARAHGGAGMQNMADRLSALGGELEVGRDAGGGARVGGWVPAPADQYPPDTTLRSGSPAT